MRRSAHAYFQGEALRMTAVFGLPIVLLIPFLEKAYHIDDTVYLWVARHIQTSPLDFYGFSMNWYGTTVPVYDFNQNPPGVSYFLAVITWFFGFGEIPTHLAMAVMAGFMSLGTYCIAREFTERPFTAALAAMLTPAALVSSNTVMSDIPMVTYYVWAVYCWIRGLETKRRWLLALSACLCAVSMLHKYYGLTAIPLLAAYSLGKERRIGSWAWYFLIPIGVLIGYQALTYFLYGVNLFSGAAEYAVRHSMDKAKLPFLTKAFIGLTFTGGLMAPVFFLMPFLWPRRVLALFGIMAVAAGIGTHFVGGIGYYPIEFLERYNWPVLVQAAIMFTAGAGILALALRDFAARQDAGALLLVLWFGGTLVFASFLNWSVNARTLLPMAPAVGILVARAIDDGLGWVQSSSVKLAPSFVLAGALAFAVLWGDWHLANAQRLAAAKFARDNERLPVQYFYKGHWGFQYYMDAAGMPDWDIVGREPALGDRIVTAENSSTQSDFNHEVARAWFDLRHEVPASRWISTMHPYVGAGFYTHFWGPLPYAFGNVPPEFYAVYELGDYRDLPPP